MAQDSEPVRRNVEKIDSRREKVAEQLAQGLNGPEISEKLGIPYSTVRDDIRAIRSEWENFAGRERIRPFQMAHIQLEQLRSKMWKEFVDLGNTTADRVLKVRYSRALIEVMREMNKLVGLYDYSRVEVKPEKTSSMPDAIPMKKFKEWLRNLDADSRAVVSAKLDGLIGGEREEDSSGNGSSEVRGVDGLQERSVPSSDVQSSAGSEDKETDNNSASGTRERHESDS